MVKRKPQSVPVHKTFTEVFDSLATSILDGKVKVENVFEYLYGHGKMHGIHFNTKFGISPETNNPLNRMNDNIKANYSLRANYHSEKLLEVKELIADASNIKRKYTSMTSCDSEESDVQEEEIDEEEYVSPLNRKGIINGKKKPGRKPRRSSASAVAASAAAASGATSPMVSAAALAAQQRRDEKWADYYCAVRKGSVQLDRKGNLVYSTGNVRSWTTAVIDSPNSVDSSTSLTSAPRLIYLGVLDIATQQKVLRDPVKMLVSSHAQMQPLTPNGSLIGPSDFGFSSAVSVCGRTVNLGAFMTAKEAAIAHDRALIRASGPCNCIDSELNYPVSSYSHDPLEKFTQYDVVLKKQLFGSSWNGPRPCDFGYLLLKERSPHKQRSPERGCDEGVNGGTSAADLVGAGAMSTTHKSGPIDPRRSRRMTSSSVVSNQQGSIFDFTGASCVGDDDGTCPTTLPPSLGTYAAIALAVRQKRDKHPGTSYHHQSHEDDHAPYFKSPQMQMRAEKRQRMMQLMADGMAKSRLGLNAFRSRHSSGMSDVGSTAESAGGAVADEESGGVADSNGNNERVDLTEERKEGEDDDEEEIGFDKSALLPPRSSLLDYSEIGCGENREVPGNYTRMQQPSINYKLEASQTNPEKLDQTREGPSTDDEMKVCDAMTIAGCGESDTVSPVTVTIVTPPSLAQTQPNSISVTS